MESTSSGSTLAVSDKVLRVLNEDPSPRPSTEVLEVRRER